MSQEVRQSTRSVWLVSGLAASCAVLVFRVSDAIIELLASYAGYSGIGGWFRGRQILIQLVVGLILAVLGVRWQHAVLEKKSLKANCVVLVIFAVLAVFPLRLQISTELMTCFPPGTEVPVPANVAPADLKCKVIDGETISSGIIITEQNVKSARAVAWDDRTYNVEIVLDSEGARKIREVTTSEIGKRIGFWLDGDLVCSPEIMAPVSSGVVHMTVYLSRQEAAEIAASLNANR